MNKIKILVVTLFIIFGFNSFFNISLSAFYDIEYPPNSRGMADYTDEDATKEKESEQVTNSEQYVGKSSNNYLKTLKIENAIIEPEFDRQNVEYKMKLKDYNYKKITITAEPEDEKAKVEGIGEIELKEGINNVRVVVTAENGAVQLYNFAVEIPYSQSELKINKLEIYGISVKTGENDKENLLHNFSSDVYNYSIEVENEITSLKISATSEDNTYISVKGEKDLEVGENKIIISVIDKNDERKNTTYEISVLKKEANVKKSDNVLVKILLGTIVIIIILIILCNKRNKKKIAKRMKR